MKFGNFGHEKSWNCNAGKVWEPWTAIALYIVSCMEPTVSAKFHDFCKTFSLQYQFSMTSWKKIKIHDFPGWF